METTEKKKHGGARAGAGRKPIDGDARNNTITCRISAKAMNNLELSAAKKGLSKNSFINELLESLL